MRIIHLRTLHFFLFLFKNKNLSCFSVTFLSFRSLSRSLSLKMFGLWFIWNVIPRFFLHSFFSSIWSILLLHWDQPRFDPQTEGILSANRQQHFPYLLLFDPLLYQRKKNWAKKIHLINFVTVLFPSRNFLGENKCKIHVGCVGLFVFFAFLNLIFKLNLSELIEINQTF